MPKLVSDVIDELVALAEAQGCKFPAEFKQNTINEFARSTVENIMWQDYSARRPMEVETYLGSPIRLSQDTKVGVPRVEALYAILHNLNLVNRSRPKLDTTVAAPVQPGSPSTTPSPLPRMSAQGPPRPMPNGNGMHPRPRPRGASSMGPPGPGMRRPPPSMNGGPPNGYPRPPPNGRLPSRRGSMEGADLEEFGHLMLYDDVPEGGEAAYGPQDIALRERELQLRQRELALREQEMRLRRPGPGMGPGPGGPGPRRGPPPPPSRGGGGFDDDDEDDDFFDPLPSAGAPMIDPDNFDMMSVTSRKNRKASGAAPNSAAQFRRNPEQDTAPPRSRFRPSFGRNRSSQVMAGMPATHGDIMDDPLLGFTSNRYGAVDRGMIHAGSRANSLTAARLDELQYNQGPPPMGMNGNGPRRVSQSPGNPYSPSIRGGVQGGRPSPPNGYHSQPQANGGGRPSPPDGMRQPMPRYPPGQGNVVAPQQVEQHAGVSALHPPKTKSPRSLTGSASASAGSGDSTNLDSEPSAHSSQQSLGPRPQIGVR